MEIPTARRTALLVDVVLALSVAIVLAISITADVGGSRSPDAIAYLFAIGLGALMFVRRQFPLLALAATVAGLIAYYIADYPPVGLAIPVAAALYSAAEAGRTTAAAAIAAALLVVTTGLRLAEGDDPAYLLGYETASSIGVMAGAVALGFGVRSRRMLQAQHERQLRQATLEREWEAERRVSEERLRIARDVHDVLGHTATVIAMQASVASEALDDDLSSSRAALDTIRRAADDAARELRGTVGLLRAGDDESRAPAPGLNQLPTLLEATRAAGLETRHRVDGTPGELPAAVDSTAYRIIQEALTNCLRHAEASYADIVITNEPARLRISVVDDGRGATGPNGDAGGEPGCGAGGEAGAGRGIAGMIERAALLGGRVEARSEPGGGFRVEAELPTEVAS